MPRFEPAINQFIAPEDQFIMTAAPCKPTRSHQRKKSNSISALERLVVFTETTQRVKRRIRNVIAGAVGASTSRPKRKSRDIMHVDYVWNGWFDPSSVAAESVPEPVALAVPRQSTLPNFAPTINRYSVNMDAESISDVSMNFGESEDEGASTPRANSPEPGTPTAAPAKELKPKKAVETEDEDEEDRHEGEDEEGEDHNNNEDHDSNHEEEDGEEEATTKVKPKKIETEVNEPLKPEDDAVSVFSPMDEDPIESACTPKAASPVKLPSRPVPKRSTTKSIPAAEDNADEKTPPLSNRTPSTESTPPKTPKLTLQTNFIRTPVKNQSHFLTGMVDVFTTSPVGLGLDLEAEIHLFKGLDLMDVIPPSAISQEGDAPIYVMGRTNLDSRRYDAEDVTEALQKPTLMAAAKLVEKKTSRKSSRRGSRASETEIIACSPRRAAIVAGKKNSKGSLNEVEPTQDLISPTTLRNKIDSLPLEQDDSIPAWGVWTLQTSIPFFHQNNSEYSVLSVQTMRNAGDPQ